MQPTQVPMVALIEVHFRPIEQRLPPWPRQPWTQVLLVSSQTLPLSTSPQSRSLVQAAQTPMVASVELQTWPSGQPLPSFPRQPGPHWLVAALQTWPLFTSPQVESTRQSTH